MSKLFWPIIFLISANSSLSIPIFKLEFDANEGPLPHVPDPKFPKMPLEFLTNLDPTCQGIFYLGTPVWSVVPDQSIINFFNGCKRVSRGFCRTKMCPFATPSISDVCYYKRSYNGGVWFGAGLHKKVRAKCDQPPGIQMTAELKRSLANLLKMNLTQNWTTNETNKKLPRTIDLPLPAPVPSKFAKEYSEECRAVKAAWNILYQKIPDEQFYTECNFTADSGKYCMEKEYRTDDQQLQGMLLRSTSGGYEVMGIKDRDSFLPACQIDETALMEMKDNF